MYTKNNNYQPKNLIRFFLGIIPLVIIALTFSCEEDPSPLGSNLLPDSDKIKFSYDISLTFIGNITDNERIKTSYLPYYNIGEIEDPHFGSFKGQFAGQFLPSKFGIDTIDSYDIDSVVLLLAIDTIYGSPQRDVSFNVYELNTAIEDSSLSHQYYSDEDISQFYSTADLINTNCNVSGDTLIRLTLSNAFKNKLISVEDDIYKNDTNFISVFDGIAITPNLLNAPGGLYTIKTSSANTKIVIYHNDNLEFSYNLRPRGIFGSYIKDYSTSYANTYLNNPESEKDELLLVQGLNGISSKITFTNIKPWIEEDSSYSILNAELIVPVVKDENFVPFYPPNQLYLHYNFIDSLISDDTLSIYIEDYLVSNSFFDGAYNSEANHYRFNISKHLLRILQEDIADSCLTFGTSPKRESVFVTTSVYPQRVILKSAENIKLNVTYTKH